MSDLFIKLAAEWHALPSYARLFLLVSLVVLFRPRTKEAYAALASKEPKWFFARLAALMKFGAAMASDVYKAREALGQIVSGKFFSVEEELARKSVPPRSNEGGFAHRKLMHSLAGIFCLCIAGCALLPFARTALNVAEIACLVGKELRTDEDFKKACQLSDAVIPEARKYMAGQRMAASRDAGPSDAGDASDSQ